MPVGWNGADPVQFADSDTYEMGTVQKANQDITVTGIRVWSGAGPLALSGRTGTVWSTGGAVLSTIGLPTNLSSGWVEFPLNTPVERTANQQWVVSFGSGGNYGFLTHALDTDQVSADGAVTSLGFAAASGNGRFDVTPGTFPATGSGAHGFFGVDVVYQLGIGGNTPPEVTALSVVDIGNGTAVATATVTDAESLTGAVLRFDWGDGTPVSVATYPDVQESHTYAASGIYPVLVSVTDTDGAAGYRAGVAEVELPADVMDGFDLTRLLNALTTHVRRIGGLERVLLHEPKSAVTSGLSAAIWFQQIDPVPGDSGLATTSLRVEFVLRYYDNMLREPADLIDPEITRLVNLAFNAFHGDFTLGGLIKQVDVLGAYGLPLRSLSGYINQSGKLQRAVSVYIPVIISDAYDQVA